MNVCHQHAVVLSAGVFTNTIETTPDVLVWRVDRSRGKLERNCRTYLRGHKAQVSTAYYSVILPCYLEIDDHVTWSTIPPIVTCLTECFQRFIALCTHTHTHTHTLHQDKGSGGSTPLPASDFIISEKVVGISFVNHDLEVVTGSADAVFFVWLLPELVMKQRFTRSCESPLVRETKLLYSCTCLYNYVSICDLSVCLNVFVAPRTTSTRWISLWQAFL